MDGEGLFNTVKFAGNLLELLQTLDVVFDVLTAGTGAGGGNCVGGLNDEGEGRLGFDVTVMRLDGVNHVAAFTVFLSNLNAELNVCSLVLVVKGFADITKIIQTNKEMGAVIDMTEILKDDADSATRTIKLVDGKDLIVIDEITSPKDKGVTYTWRMVGNGEPEVMRNMIVLRAEGKTMILKAKGNVKFRYTTWSAEPKAYYDDPNDGKYIVGIESFVPEGKVAKFIVTLSPR